jgi:hypothetical protein
LIVLPPRDRTVVGDTTSNQALLAPPRRPAWGIWAGLAAVGLGVGGALWMGTSGSTVRESLQQTAQNSRPPSPVLPSLERPPPPSPARSSTRAETVLVPVVVIESPEPRPSPSAVRPRPTPIKKSPSPTPCVSKQGPNGSIVLDCD